MKIFLVKKLLGELLPTIAYKEEFRFLREYCTKKKRKRFKMYFFPSSFRLGMNQSLEETP